MDKGIRKWDLAKCCGDDGAGGGCSVSINQTVQ